MKVLVTMAVEVVVEIDKGLKVEWFVEVRDKAKAK